MIKILKAEDLNELKELGYKIVLFHGGIRTQPVYPKWINPNTYWNCEISDKIVNAELYKYVPKTDRSNIKLIRY